MGQRDTKHTPENMLAVICLIFVQLVTGQRVTGQRNYTTKFTDCGSLLDIADALEGPVKITAPYHRKKGRHILGKGKKVMICVNGRITNNIPLPVAGAGLKNSAHGKVLLGGLTVPLPVEFCDVEKKGCKGASPACEDMKPGDSVTLCSSLTVPTASPDVDVEVTWKVLREEVADKKCETEFDLRRLADKKKLPLVCINIPARVQPPRTRTRG